MPKARVDYAPVQTGNARESDQIRRALERALPEWARGSKLIADVELAAATAKVVPHGMARAHRGWILARIVSANNAAGVVEIPTTDASYNADLADTHLQLRGNAAATVSLVVF